MEATLTIAPPPRSRMRGSTARAHSHIERRSTAKNVSHSSGDIETGSKPGVHAGVVDEHVHRTELASTVENAFATSAGELTSQRVKSMLPEASLSSASTSSEATEPLPDRTH